jgi:hypothetical protein
MCHKAPPTTCTKCERQAKLAEEKRQKEFALQQKRDAEQREHARRLAEFDEKIAAENQAVRDAQLAEERANAIYQREKDLEEAASLAARAASFTNTAQKTSGAQSSQQTTHARPIAKSTVPVDQISPAQTTDHTPVANHSQSVPKSSSQEEWQHMKDIDGASNHAIDAIMQMIGLEEVKAQVLKIKSKIDVTKRQNTSLKDERFNIVLLGNPGTGTILVFILVEAEADIADA